MQRLIFQRTGHPRRYHALPASQTARHDTFVSHQGRSTRVLAARPPCPPALAPRCSPRRRDASDNPGGTRYFLHSIWSGLVLPLPPPAQGSFGGGLLCLRLSPLFLMNIPSSKGGQKAIEVRHGIVSGTVVHNNSTFN